jgi:hypothetical protein
MKFYETHFDEYITEVKKENLQPKLEKIYGTFPKNISDLTNIIFYGPAGVGKYSQMLYSIKKYSPSDLKYEKKIIITSTSKQQYIIKISDIHYEIDMSLLGCNSKMLWNEIYDQIVDVVSMKPDKTGIVVCKNFQEINSELLENFYSYIQKCSSVDLKYILITEELSFLPDNILNCCKKIRVTRPTKNKYNSCMNTNNSSCTALNKATTTSITNIINTNTRLNDIRNCKDLKCLSTLSLSLKEHKIICDKILKAILTVEDFQYSKFRDLLYDILIYNLNVTECIWYILSFIIEEKKIPTEKLGEMLNKTYSFLRYYNNNYRPIYHLELYLLYIMKIANGF